MKDWEKIRIRKDLSILETMKIIDLNSSQFAVVVDEVGRLIGTVTDGDIRRGIIRDVPKSAFVEHVMNTKPRSLSVDWDAGQILEFMKNSGLTRIPIVDNAGIIVRVDSIEDLLGRVIRRSKVVIMAGGLGSRLGPLTESCPKPMLKVGSKPVLERIIERVSSFGFSDICISVNYLAEMIEDYFGNGSSWNVKIRYLKETTRMGTAGALSFIAEETDHPVLVINGDVLTKVNLSRLLEFHEESASAATMCVRQYDFQIPYGVIETDGIKIRSISEKPLRRFFVNAGVYVLNPSVIQMIPGNSEFDMTALFQKVIDSELKTAVFPIHEYWLDIGKLEDFERAQSDIGREF